MHGEVGEAVERLCASFARRHGCPSLSWGVSLSSGGAGEGGTWTGGLGALDDGRPPTARTVYRIASMTKSFTAATVLALRDEGVLRLDDPVTAHWPALSALAGGNADGDAAPVRVRDLLTMSSGLANDDAWADRHLDLADDGLDAVVANGAHFAFPPGTAFEYSNLGYAILGRIVERATGSRVQDHVQSRFIQPLRLRRTTWVVPDHDDWARPYRKVGAGHAPELLAGDGALAPLGGIWSCVEDVTRWSQWLADAHPARHGADDGPLRRASRREMQQLHRFSENEKLAGRAAPTGYGYGLTRREDPALGSLVGHSGGLPGYGSNMRWAPGRGAVVVAMANVTYPPIAELTLRIFDELHRAGAIPSVTVALDPDLDRLARSLVELLQDWDDGRADALFTDNVALDEPYDRRRAKALELIGSAGPMTITGITATSAAAAAVMLLDATGATLKLEVELAPLVPVRIESYSLTRPRKSRP